ncbi:MAG TPA: hypothetical protein P5318_05285 [Candidatus Hydrogenedentes bacterium]|nr:hypothetical protein [Candidatus Hydrogenedentota bacterium]HRT64222.1 hypothetical protein [Candidatus Hydrogenedentota bacterium]
MFTSVSSIQRPIRCLPATVICLLACACSRLGPHVEQGVLPPGAPPIAAILGDLAANDQAIRNFKAKGAFTLASPDLAAVKSFDDGFVAFRRPADLCVIGRKYLGAAVFRLTCVGSEFLIEFPAAPEEQPYYRLEGEQFDSVPFSVSPSDIAREMFLPEDWAELRENEVRMAAYDETKQQATIVIGRGKTPRRIVSVIGPPWVVSHSERLDEDGRTLAVTLKNQYVDVEGIRFPSRMEVEFPLEQTRMTLDLRKVWPNTELGADWFDIKARARIAGVDVKRSARENRPPQSTGER